MGEHGAIAEGRGWLHRACRRSCVPYSWCVRTRASSGPVAASTGGEDASGCFVERHAAGAARAADGGGDRRRSASRRQDLRFAVTLDCPAALEGRDVRGRCDRARHDEPATDLLVVRLPAPPSPGSPFAAPGPGTARAGRHVRREPASNVRRRDRLHQHVDVVPAQQAASTGLVPVGTRGLRRRGVSSLRPESAAVDRQRGVHHACHWPSRAPRGRGVAGNQRPPSPRPSR